MGKLIRRFEGNWWDKQGWMDKNPMRNVEIPKTLTKEPRILTVAETAAL